MIENSMFLMKIARTQGKSVFRQTQILFLVIKS